MDFQKEDTLSKQDQKSYSLLLVEDHRPSAIVVKELFEHSTQNNFKITWVQSLALATEALNKYNFDVIILDLGLPDSDGMDTFYDVYERAPHTPVVIFTAIEDKNLALQAIRHGAQDYLIKNEFQIPLFYRSIHYAMERKRLQNELAEKIEHLNVLFKSVGDALIATDENLQITHFNPVAEHLTGWNANEAIGHPLHAVLSLTHLDRERNADRTLSRIAETGKFQSPFNGSVLLNRDNEPLRVDGILAPIYAHKDKAIGLIIAFRESAKTGR